VYKTLSKPRHGELRIQKKIILNKNNSDYLEVAIGEIEVVDKKFRSELHYIISFGGGKKIRIIGKQEWSKFLDMLQWLDWNPKDTQEIDLKELDDDKTYENSIPSIPVTSQTLEFELDEEEIIDGIPIYDDEE